MRGLEPPRLEQPWRGRGEGRPDPVAQVSGLGLIVHDPEGPPRGAVQAKGLGELLDLAEGLIGDGLEVGVVAAGHDGEAQRAVMIALEGGAVGEPPVDELLGAISHGISVADAGR